MRAACLACYVVCVCVGESHGNEQVLIAHNVGFFVGALFMVRWSSSLHEWACMLLHDVLLCLLLLACAYACGVKFEDVSRCSNVQPQRDSAVVLSVA